VAALWAASQAEFLPVTLPGGICFGIIFPLNRQSSLADVAQSAEHPPCKRKVTSSILVVGSKELYNLIRLFECCRLRLIFNEMRRKPPAFKDWTNIRAVTQVANGD
jgi:hypothetical protein